MTAVTTPTTPTAWSPDVTFYRADEVVDAALIMQIGTFAGSIEGDAPSVRVPWVRTDPEASFTPEGEVIPEGTGSFDETVITTSKLASLGRFSRETLAQPSAAQLIINSMRRGLTDKADRAFLGSEGDPVGLLGVDGVNDGGVIGADLDALADALVTIESAGGTASAIVAAPDAWGALAKMKSGADSAQPLLGAGTEATERRLLGVEVRTTDAMPANTLLVLDSASVLTVHGQVQLARSEHAHFDSDTVAIRLLFRVGWAVMRPERLVRLTTTGVAEG